MSDRVTVESYEQHCRDVHPLHWTCRACAHLFIPKIIVNPYMEKRRYV
jgi:hypothetical protein